MYLRDIVPIMRTRERHLFFLQKTIELSYWLDEIFLEGLDGGVQMSVVS